MTKKSLSNGWVVSLKDSYLFQTFSFEIFFFVKVFQQKSGNRVPTNKVLENGKKTSNPFKALAYKLIFLKLNKFHSNF